MDPSLFISGIECAKIEILLSQQERWSEMNIKTIGIDLAKNIFHVYGVDKHGKLVQKKRLTRKKIREYMVKLPPCLVEAQRIHQQSTYSVTFLYCSRLRTTVHHDKKKAAPQGGFTMVST